MRASIFPLTASLASILGVAADADVGKAIEFRYCPAIQGRDEWMQACKSTAPNLSALGLPGGFDSENTSRFLNCRYLDIQNDPIVTILSNLLSDDSALIGVSPIAEKESTILCGEGEILPWSISVNDTINTQTLLKSWGLYTGANKLHSEGEKIPEPGSLPEIIPKILCRISLGFTYEKQCKYVLETLWVPLGGLEKIFPFQFSQYCYLCWWVGAVVFDVLHWLLHRFHNSKYKILRKLAWIHMVHHYYFNRSLQFNEKYAWHNTWVELPVEGLCLYIGSLIAWYGCAYFGLTDVPGGFTADIFRKIAFTQVGKTVYTMYKEGKDANHPIGWKTVPKDPEFLSVGAEYHCLHHVEPDAYYSSIHRFFDHIIGASSTLKGKRILMTGASGAYGQALIKLLQKEKIKSLDTLTFGNDWTHSDFALAIPKLQKADVLILAHGTKGPDAMQANCHSAVKLIELFRLHRKPLASTSVVQMLPEVWYVGSEIEIGSSFGEEEMLSYSASKRAFARYARAYYDDEDFLYRHIVPAGFTSRMGEGLVSAGWAAAVTMLFIRRGSRYTPVTYTLMAYANYFKFMYFTEPLKAERLTAGLTDIE